MRTPSWRGSPRRVDHVSEMAFDPCSAGGGQDARRSHGAVRPYEISNAAMTTDMTPDNGDDMLRQVGIKIWVDGSPWIGNIDLSFPYLDTEATRNHRA